MSEFWLTKTLSQRLAPADEDAESYVKRLTVGEAVLCKVTKPRNAKFHRKFFALLKVGFDNQERYDDFEAFRTEVTIRSGFWREHRHLDGQISISAKSIAFHAMDDLEFGKLYGRAIDVIIQYFMDGTDPDDLQQAVEEIIGFA